MKTCPSCYIELHQALRQGIEVDYCPQCRGVWLDHGELDKLIQLSTQLPYGHPASGHPYPPQQPPYQAPQHSPYQAPQHPPYQAPHQPSHQGHYAQQGHYNQQAGHYGAHDTYGKGYKKHKKHKHEHPVADFLGDVFDFLG